MKYSKFLIVSMAVLLAGGVAFAQTEPPYVFTSDPSGGSIAVIDLATGWADEIYPNGGSYEDLVYGPDGRLYACDPEGQEIVRLILAYDDGIYVDDVEYVYTLNGDDGEAWGSGEDLSPQCGWFTSKGDFIFTDVEGRGLWMCKDLAFGDFDGGQQDDPICQAIIPAEDGPMYSELVPVPAAGFDFYGEGVTQLAGGDALAVQIIPYEGEIYGEGAILQFAMDKATGTFRDEPPQPLLDENGDPLDLEDPQGIARLSTGDIFVTNFFDGWSGIKRFTPVRDPETEEKYYLNTCNIALDSEGGHGQPFFLEAAADDTVYVGSNYGGFAELWAITVDGNDECVPVRVFPPVEPPVENGWQPDQIYGIALTPTWTLPSSIEEDEPGEYFISFNDHVYELSLPNECTLNEETVLAEEIPLDCLENLIANRVIVPEGLEAFSAYPVTYLGEEGFGIVYNLEGVCGETNEEIIHAISAYTETVNNPRILKCYDHNFGDGGISLDVCDPGGDYWCDVLDLDSFFPGEGVLPDDGRIGSRGAASFSQYFVVQSGPTGYDPYNPAAAGESCGFYWPYKGLTEPPATECFGCGDPPVFGPFAWAAFRAVEDAEQCGWWWGADYIWETEFLASVARVRDENGLPVFEQMELDTFVHGDSDNWFRQPWRRWRPYLIKFWTYDWPEGLYQITAMDLEGGVPVFYDYFEIRHWCDNPTEKGCN